MKKTISKNCSNNNNTKYNFYFVRHATTLANLTKIKQRFPDTMLNDIGIQQAEIAGKYFKNIDIDLMCTSLLSRTIETMTYMRKSILEEKKIRNSNIYPIPFITEKTRGVRGLFELNKDNYPYILSLLDKKNILKDKRKHLLNYHRKELYPNDDFNVQLNLLLYKIVLQGLYGENYNQSHQIYLDLSDFTKFKKYCVPLIINYLETKYPHKKIYNVIIVTHGRFIREDIIPEYKIKNSNCMILKIPYYNNKFLKPCIIFNGFKKGKLY